MTQEEYKQYIIPFFENIRSFLKNTTLTDFQKGEKLFVENILIKLVENETQPKRLYELLSTATKKEIEICNKYDINIDIIKKLLEKE